jgi:hypothetical protein
MRKKKTQNPKFLKSNGILKAKKSPQKKNGDDKFQLDSKVMHRTHSLVGEEEEAEAEVNNDMLIKVF